MERAPRRVRAPHLLLLCSSLLRSVGEPGVGLALVLAAAEGADAGAARAFHLACLAWDDWADWCGWGMTCAPAWAHVGRSWSCEWARRRALSDPSTAVWTSIGGCGPRRPLQPDAALFVVGGGSIHSARCARWRGRGTRQQTPSPNPSLARVTQRVTFPAPERARAVSATDASLRGGPGSPACAAIARSSSCLHRRRAPGLGFHAHPPPATSYRVLRVMCLVVACRGLRVLSSGRTTKKQGWAAPAAFHAPASIPPRSPGMSCGCCPPPPPKAEICRPSRRPFP